MSDKKSSNGQKISSQVSNSQLPVEIRGWNWGAFLLNWIWGIGNDTYRAFWVFVPGVNIVMLIALGLKGNEWAWRHGEWQSAEHFKQVQRKWRNAGFIFTGIIVVFCVISVFGINALFKNSDAYKVSFAQVSDSKEVQSRIGSPLDSGFITGSITTSGPDGTASLAYPVEGPKGEAKVALYASKKLNKWTLECLVVNYKSVEEQTIIVPCD